MHTCNPALGQQRKEAQQVQGQYQQGQGQLGLPEPRLKEEEKGWGKEGRKGGPRVPEVPALSAPARTLLSTQDALLSEPPFGLWPNYSPLPHQRAALPTYPVMPPI